MQRTEPGPRARSHVIALALSVFIAAASARPAFADEPHAFHIAAADAPSAVREFAHQSGVQIMASADALKDKSFHSVTGKYSTEDALQILLADSGLTHEYVGERGVVLVLATSSSSTQERASTTKTESSAETPGEEGGQKKSFWDRFRLAQVDQGANSQPSTVGSNTSGSREQNVKLEEIIVTAQKKSERLQDVPVPVSVLESSELVQSNQLRLQDYFSSVPGLSVAPVTAAGNEQVLTIRGIGTGLGTNPTVGVTVDDVPFGSSTFGGGSAIVPDLDPSDLERVEVLRGPQGTLYGASSMGGLIKFVTVDPSTASSSGRLEAGWTDVSHGEDSGYNMRGSINVPLSETAAVRASGFARQDPGYIDSAAYDVRGINEDRAHGGHLVLSWKPSEHASLKFSALYQKLEADGSNNVDLPTAGYPQTNGVGPWQQIDLPGLSAYESKVEAYSLTLNAKLGGDVELTSVSGYNINDNFLKADLANLFGAGSGDVVYTKNKKFTQELRLSGAAGARFEWLLGAFYTHESAPGSGQYFVLDTSTLQFSSLLFDSTAQNTYSEYAGFADLTVHFTDRFSVQIGGRESHIKEGAGQVFAGPLYGSEPFVFPTLEMTNNAFTYLLTPQLKISPDLMAYVRLASGYRAGGPNNAPGVPLNFEPDKTLNYELGIKGDAYGHALSFDASVYYIDWRNIQLNLIDPVSQFGYTGNAGTARSHGVELSVEARPARGTKLAAWVSWNDATLTESFPAESVALGSVYGASGDRLPYAARYSANVSVDQQFELGNRRAVFFGGNVNYIGDRQGEFTSPPPAVPPRQNLPGYVLVNLHTGVTYGSWTGSLFANNLFNRAALLAGGLGGFPPFAYTYVQPRTVGLSLAKTFDPSL